MGDVQGGGTLHKDRAAQEDGRRCDVLACKVKGRTEVSHFAPQEREVRKFMANCIGISKGRRSGWTTRPRQHRKRVPEHVEINGVGRQLGSLSLDRARRSRPALWSGESATPDPYFAGDQGAAGHYIHGGYWQRGAKSTFLGVNAVVSTSPSVYSLCPAVSVMDIVGEWTLSCGPMEDRRSIPRRRPLRRWALTAAMVAQHSSRRRGRHQRRVRSPPPHQPVQRGAAPRCPDGARGKPPVLAATAQGSHAGGGGRRGRKRGVPAAKPGYRGGLEAGGSRVRVPRSARCQPLHGGGRADEACERALQQGRRSRTDVTRWDQLPGAPERRIPRDRAEKSARIASRPRKARADGGI